MDASIVNPGTRAVDGVGAVQSGAPRMLVLRTVAGACSAFAVILLLLGIAPDRDPLLRHDYLVHAAVAAAIACLTLLYLLGRALKRVEQTEKELRREREQAEIHAARWQFALDSAGDGLWDWNGVTGEAFVSSQWMAMLGYTGEDDVRSLGTWADLVHPEDRERAIALRNDCLAGRVPMLTSEQRVRCADGSYKWVLNRGKVTARDADGRALRMIGTQIDLTERREREALERVNAERLRFALDASKAAEDAIRREKAFVESLVQNLVTPTFVVNPDGTVRIWNRAVEELSGYRAAEIVGTRRHREAFYGFQRVTLVDLVLAGHTPQNGDPYVKLEPLPNVPGGLYCENWCPLRDGSTHYLAGSAGPIYHADGTLAAVVETMHDLTAQQNMQIAIAQARDDALAATRAKSAFLANMSHEIRTPMNGVLGMAGLLLDTGLDDEQRAYAETLAGSARHLLGVINDILDFSKIEAGRLGLDAIDFDLREVVEEAVTVQAQPAYGKGLELCCEFDPALPMCLHGDEGRLRQMLLNLIGNAVKFTHTGSITVGARLIDEDRDGVRFRIEITDTGIGVPTEHLRELFTAFAQGDTSTTRRFGGTGLGLAICKELVALMSGEIGCDTATGTGSTFWFVLRLPRAAAPMAVARPPALDPSLRVLVADASPCERTLLAELIAACGLTPRFVPNAEAAMAELEAAALAGHAYSLAVLEHRPGSDQGLVARIRSTPALAGLGLVLLTIPGARAGVPGAGLSFVPKPVRRATLWRAFRTAIAADTASANRLRAEAPGTDRRPSRGRLLVVEDNVTNRQVARATLEKLGFDVDLAEDGVAAIQALAAQDYDLVLMDCQMPVMDGYTATRTIRDPASRVRNHDIPIIAMTAHALATDREECLAAGMNDYLSKPIVPDLMAQMFERWLLPGEVTAQTPAGVRPLPAPDASFDRRTLLDRLMGDEELLAEILAAFRIDAAAACLQLAAAIDGGDTATAARLCHTLKGTAANVGALELRDLAAGIEAAAKRGDLLAMRAGLPVIQSALASFWQIASGR